MLTKTLWRMLALTMVLAMALSGCAQSAATPEVVGGFQIPAIEEGKFNVAAVLIGPHDDGGLVPGSLRRAAICGRECSQRACSLCGKRP
jgi:hypothetical protein